MAMEFPEKSKSELMAEILDATGFNLMKIVLIDLENRILREDQVLSRLEREAVPPPFTYPGLEKILLLLGKTRGAVALLGPITVIDQTAYIKVNAGFGAEVFVPLLDGSSRLAGVIYMARQAGGTDFPRSDVYIVNMRLLIHMLEQEMLQGVLKDNLMKTVLLLCEIINAKEPMMMSNLYAVSHWAVRIARQMRLSEREIQKLQLAALMHNLGKIYIDEQVLSKAEFTQKEQELLNKRTVHSYEIALRLGRIYDLEDIPEIILRFQERVDGKGYPGALAGEEIPLLSRILCVAKALTAMFTNKPNRKARSLEEVVGELIVNAGSQFDRRVSDAAQTLLLNRTGEQEDYFSGIGNYATLSITADWQTGETVQVFGRVYRTGPVYVFSPVEKVPAVDARLVSKCALYLDINERILQFEAEIGKIHPDRILLSKVVPQRVEDAFSVLWFMEGVFITNEKNIHRVYINLLGGDYLDFYIFNEENPTSFTSGIVKVALSGQKDTYLPGIITFRQQMNDKVFYRFKYTNVSEAERQQVFAVMFQKQLEMRSGVTGKAAPDKEKK